MADPINFLIGRGETLVQPIELLSGGGAKAHPYTFDEAMARLRPELDLLSASVESLPALACPNGEAVVSVTLHPSYLAKTYHPSRLLNGLGLRQVGSRERRLIPEKWTQKEPPSQAVVAPELFVAGSRDRLARFGELVRASSEVGIHDDFRRIEHIAPLSAARLGNIPGTESAPPLEVVLHADASERWGEGVLRGFHAWCRALGIEADFSRRQQVGGLAFLGFHVPRDAVVDMAKFAFLRTARRMAKISFRDVELRSIEVGTPFLVQSPSFTAVDTSLRAAIFDGGLPEDHPFSTCVARLDAPGVGRPTDIGLRHGTQVTSALLHGPLKRDEGKHPVGAASDYERARSASISSM